MAVLPVTPNATESTYFTAPYDLTIAEVGVYGMGASAFNSASGDVTLRIEADPAGTSVVLTASGAEVLDPVSSSARSPVTLSATPGDLDVDAGTIIEIAVTYPADTTPASGGFAVIDIIYSER
jgi:hypothetical protein